MTFQRPPPLQRPLLERRATPRWRARRREQLEAERVALERAITIEKLKGKIALKDARIAELERQVVGLLTGR